MFSPMQAIRQKCLDCCCYQFIQVKACPSVKCPLWMFRLGINPNCGDNAKNPLLDTKNFIGKENTQAGELLKSIGEQK